MKCNYCGKDEVLPFKCQYCQGFFCAEHRLPENHNCSQIEKARAPREEPPPFEYKVTFTPARRLRKFSLSQTELKHLSVSALLVSGVGLSMLVTSLESINWIIVVGLVISFTLAFLVHELVHKIVAQHYGLWAEFRLMLFGSLLTLLSIIVPFPKFIAPGAVMIAGVADKKTIGKTSVAGPLTNIVFCGVSFALTFTNLPVLFEVALLTAAFNAFIAVMNLIPFAILDGLKVFEWSKLVWAMAFGSSVALLIGIAARYPSLFGL